MGQAAVLVAEDDPQVAKLLSRLLAAAGYRTVVAADGDAAVAAAGREAFDAVVIDLSLAPHGARPALERLRAAQPGLGVLAISGQPPDAAMDAWLREAGARFVAKPFAPAALVDALTALIDRGAA
jgi:DNA-binding response OmpR family regulator